MWTSRHEGHARDARFQEPRSSSARRDADHRLIQPYGGKNIDTLCKLFAESIETGRRSEALPEFRDAALASEYAWRFLRDAREHDLPAIGELETLRQIRERRRTMKDGYGLLRKHA